MAKDKMKAWYDDIDAATLQRIKTYSAFNDVASKHLMMQTMYEYREKEIQDFKETNHELAETCIARKKRINELEKEKAELKNVIKLLITTLDDTTWDEGHPGYSDSEPSYNCPGCSCKDCYRVSCQFNESELFKKLHKEFPELYENEKEIKEYD